MAEASESFGTYHYALDNPVMFNDPLGDKAQSDVDQIVAKILQHSKGAGGRWSWEREFEIYEDDETAFLLGAGLMGDQGLWGTNGFAANFDEAVASFTGGDKNYVTQDGYLISGLWFTDGKGNRITLNGKSGEFNVSYVGNKYLNKKKEPSGESFFEAVWNSDFVRQIIPDMVGIHFSGTLVPTIGGGYSFNIDFLTRGKDAGFHISHSFSARIGEEAGVGASLVTGKYIGSVSEINYGTLMGWGVDGNVAFTPINLGGWASINTDNKTPSISWYGNSVGAGIGYGGSAGVSYTIR